MQCFFLTLELLYMHSQPTLFKHQYLYDLLSTILPFLTFFKMNNCIEPTPNIYSIINIVF